MLRIDPSDLLSIGAALWRKSVGCFGSEGGSGDMSAFLNLTSWRKLSDLSK